MQNQQTRKKRSQGRFDQVFNAIARCGTIGGKDRALEVADAGGWSHAYQEVQVAPGSVYTVTGLFFPEKAGVCDGGAVVKWCSPSVVICPGGYDALFYKTGGCYVGEAPSGNGSWVPFSASFTPTVATMTIYIPQESTRYSSWVRDVKLTSPAAEECTLEFSLRFVFCAISSVLRLRVCVISLFGIKGSRQR